MKEKEKKNLIPGAVVIAFLASVIVYIVMINAEKNILSEYEKETVLIMQTDLVKGVELTAENLVQYVTEVAMDKNLIPEAAVYDMDQLVGQMTVSDIDKGVVLTRSMLEGTESQSQGLHNPVIAGFKADDLYQVVSGTLRSGDRIHIYTIEEESGQACLIWENILVKQVFDSAGSMITPDDKVTAAGRVNILLEQDNVEQFYSELTTGSLRVVKVWK